jgi:KTSC domain
MAKDIFDEFVEGVGSDVGEFTGSAAGALPGPAGAAARLARAAKAAKEAAEEALLPQKDVWHYVPSSNVVGFMWTKGEFTGSRKKLYIKFKWGAEYEYTDVDDFTIVELSAASSPGQFVNQNMKRYNYSRVL